MENILVLVNSDNDRYLNDVQIIYDDDFIADWGRGYFSYFMKNSFSKDENHLNYAAKELLHYAPNSIEINGTSIIIKDSVMAEVAHNIKHSLAEAIKDSDSYFAKKSWQYNKLIYDYTGTYICYYHDGYYEVFPIKQWLMDNVRNYFIKNKLHLKIIQVAVWK